MQASLTWGAPIAYPPEYTLLGDGQKTPTMCFTTRSPVSEP